jgi:diguanylate cyclase (GGDEF)-like protein/PAS domain S-box-containing protein
LQSSSTPSLETLLHLLPEAVVQTDGHWNLTFVNPAWQRMTGHDSAASLGRSLLDFVHPEDCGMLKSGLPVFRLLLADQSGKQVLKQRSGSTEQVLKQRSGSTEQVLKQRSGSTGQQYRWVRLQLQAGSDEHGRVTTRNGVLAEIDESTQKVMIEVRQRFLRLLETFDGVVWEAERGVGNTFLSNQVEHLFGYTTEEWRSDPNFWRSLVHPDDFAEALAIDEAAYNATHSYAYEMSYRLRAKSGAWIWVRDLCRVIVEANVPTRMIGLMIDVTRHKQTELDLIKSENRYALALRGSNDGIWDWDLKADVLHVSARFLDIVGLRDSEQILQGGWRFMQALIHPDDLDRVQCAFQAHLEGSSANLSVDFRAIHGAGHSIWVNWRGLAQREAGAAMRLAGSLTDLAERGSFYDPLTKLPGRPLFRDRLAQALARHSENPRHRFALMLLDLNRFKSVNDSMGHHVGDLLLQEVSRRLEATVRRADLAARMSGDEFVVLLEAISADDAREQATRISHALAQPYRLAEHVLQSGASIGLVTSDAGLSAIDDYLRAADAAMYQAKQSGVGLICFAQNN